MTAWVKLKAPFRFVSMTVSQSSIDIRMLSPSRVTPALFTRMSTRPKSSRIFALVCWTGGVIGNVDRVGLRGVGAAGVDLVGGALRGLSLRLTEAIRAPSFASRTAMACPIPRPAPVTTAT